MENRERPEFPRMHVSLFVKDIEKTVSFYRTFFGREATKVKPGYAKFIMKLFKVG